MNISLSRRLRTAADYVREGAVTADIGCDHGKLSAFLLQSKKAPFVYAGDIRPLPLQKAQQLLAHLGLQEKSRCLCTNGLEGMPGSEIEDVVIAGLGCDVIASVITAAPWLKHSSKHLILVPASKHPDLRRFLAAEGFATLKEEAVCEMGHCYTVILAAYSGEVRQLSEREAQLGCMDLTTDDGAKYLAAVTARMQRVLQQAGDRQSAGTKAAAEFLRGERE